MTVPIEANSLSELIAAAENPPARLDKQQKRREGLTLYIARVPGSRDVILSTLKPRDKVVSAQDIESCLYYCHVDSMHDEEIIDEIRNSQDEGSGLLSTNGDGNPPVPVHEYPAQTVFGSKDRPANIKIPRIAVPNLPELPTRDPIPDLPELPARESIHRKPVPGSPQPSPHRKPVGASPERSPERSPVRKPVNGSPAPSIHRKPVAGSPLPSPDLSTGISPSFSPSFPSSNLSSDFPSSTLSPGFAPSSLSPSNPPPSISSMMSPGLSPGHTIPRKSISPPPGISELAAREQGPRRIDTRAYRESKENARPRSWSDLPPSLPLRARTNSTSQLSPELPLRPLNANRTNSSTPTWANNTPRQPPPARPSSMISMRTTKTADDDSPTKQCPIFGERPIRRTRKMFSLTLIRRDPSSGIQENIGKIELPPGDDSNEVTIQLTTPGYTKFVPGVENGTTSPPEDPDAPLPVYSTTVTLPVRRNRRNSTNGGMEPPPLPPPSTKQPHTFTTPYNTLCAFATGVSGKTLRCRHLRHTLDLSHFTAAELLQLRSEPVSELRVHLPVVHPLGKVQVLRAHEEKKAAAQAAARAKAVAAIEGKTASGGSRRTSWLGRRGSEEKDRLRDDAGSLGGSGGGSFDYDRDFDVDYFYDDIDTFFDEVDGEREKLDLTLGKENAGGGFGGKKAKLGKLIIEPEGLMMLDLIVAANVGVWWTMRR